MKNLTPQSMGASWLAGMKAPRTKQKYVEGINATAGNPMAMAAAKVDLWAERVQASKAKFVAKLNAADPAMWKNNAIAKADRLATGADTGQPKYVNQMGKWIQVYQQAHSVVQNMPKGTIQNAIDRAAAAITVLMQAAGRA